MHGSTTKGLVRQFARKGFFLFEESTNLLLSLRCVVTIEKFSLQALVERLLGIATRCSLQVPTRLVWQSILGVVFVFLPRASYYMFLPQWSVVQVPKVAGKLRQWEELQCTFQGLASEHRIILEISCQNKYK